MRLGLLHQMLFTAKQHEAKQSMSVVFNVVALFGVLWLVSHNKLITINQNCVMMFFLVTIWDQVSHPPTP